MLLDSHLCQGSFSKPQHSANRPESCHQKILWNNVRHCIKRWTLSQHHLEKLQIRNFVSPPIRDAFCARNITGLIALSLRLVTSRYSGVISIRYDKPVYRYQAESRGNLPPPHRILQKCSDSALVQCDVGKERQAAQGTNLPYLLHFFILTYYTSALDPSTASPLFCIRYLPIHIKPLAFALIYAKPSMRLDAGKILCFSVKVPFPNLFGLEPSIYTQKICE